MFESFRLRLTLWYVGVLAVVLTLFSLGVYSLLARNVRERFDGELRAAMTVTALSLHHEIAEHHGKEGGEAALRQVLTAMRETSFPRPSVAIYDGSRFVAGKTGTAGPPEISPAEREGLADLVYGNERFRVGTMATAISQPPLRYTVVAGESMEEMEAELASFRRILYFCVPLGLLFAAGGGYFLAVRNLAPVMAMTREVWDIRSANLHRRLTVSNPKDELGRLATTFNDLLERLDHAFAEQRQFMADASHELRTPLSVALTAAQVNLQAQHASESELREALRVVVEQLARLRRIVQDMFLLAQADSGAARPKKEAFYLDENIASAVRAAQVLGAKRNVSVIAEGLTECACMGDETLIHQLLMILLDNAVRHSPAGGEVKARLRSGKFSLEIAVIDQGEGVPATDRERIFERFYRSGSSRSRLDGGAGLGLAIARWIAALHGGTLTLEPGDGGACFVLRLPVSELTS